PQTGRQVFLQKLQQLMAKPDIDGKAPPKEAKPPLPADRARGFAAAAHRKINGALLRCEERYPNEGPHSVLYVVVDRDAANCHAPLRSLHDEYFGPGQTDPLAPTRL